MPNPDLAFDTIAVIFGNGRTTSNIKVTTNPGGSMDSRDMGEIESYIADSSDDGTSVKCSLTTVSPTSPDSGGDPMEMAGVSAELTPELEALCKPTLTLYNGGRKIGVWLLDKPANVMSGEAPDGILALNSVLSVGDGPLEDIFDWHSFPLPGYGGWEVDLSHSGHMYSIRELNEKMGPIQFETSPSAAPIVEGADGRPWHDATVYGDELDDAFRDREIEVGFSPYGISTKRDGWKNKTFTVESLLDALSYHKVGKKDGTCLLQGGLVGSERRATAVKHMDIMMLDLDTGQDMATVRQRIRDLGLLCVIYTTHSHLGDITEIKKDTLVKFCGGSEPSIDDAKKYLIDKRRYQSYILNDAILLDSIHATEGVMMRIKHAPMPKMRLVFFLDKRVVVANRLPVQKDVIQEWKEKYAGLADMVGAFYDRSCTDPSRLMYFPRHQAGFDYAIELLIGKPLHYDDIPRVALKGERVEADDSNPFESAAREMGVGKQTDTTSLMWFIGKYASVFEADDFLREMDPDGDRGERSGGPGRTHRCPNDDAHSNAGDEDDKGFFCVNASDGDGFVMKCMHDSCAELDRVALLDISCKNAGIEAATDLTKFCSELLEEETPKKEKEEEREALVPFESARVAKEAISKLVRGESEAALALARRIQITKFSAGNKKDLLTILSKQSGVGIPALTLEAKAASVEDSTGGMKDDLVGLLTALNKEYAVVALGGKTKILMEPDHAGESPEFLDPESFRLLLSTQKILMEDTDGEKKLVPISRVWLDWEDRRSYKRGIVFDPVNKNPASYNLWRGFAVKPKRGDWGLMKAHIFDNICQGNLEYFDWLITWIAQIYQQPGTKLGSAVAIRGKKGTGKSILADWVAKSMGVHAMKVSQKAHITGNFNAHQMGKVLLVCEEAFWAGDPQAGGVLKDLITSDQMVMEKKGIDAYMVGNYCRLWMISNEDWVVPAGLEGERRFFVLECGNDHWQDTEYFEAIREQMEQGGCEAMVDFFMNWKPTTAKGWNILRKPPVTPWLIEQALESLETSDRFFLRVIDDGHMTDVNAPPGFDRIDLTDDDGANYIPYEGLRWHYERFIMGSYSKRHMKNDKYFQGRAQEWLLCGSTLVDRTINGEKRRCYRVPSLSVLRNAVLKKGIPLSTVETED